MAGDLLITFNFNLKKVLQTQIIVLNAVLQFRSTVVLYPACPPSNNDFIDCQIVWSSCHGSLPACLPAHRPSLRTPLAASPCPWTSAASRPACAYRLTWPPSTCMPSCHQSCSVRLRVCAALAWLMVGGRPAHDSLNCWLITMASSLLAPHDEVLPTQAGKGRREHLIMWC